MGKLWDTIKESAGGGIVGAGMGLLGGAADMIFGGAKMKKEVAAQKEMMDYQYEKQMAMYNRQFRDNTPEAQKARLEAAGMNPALMYGMAQGAGGATFSQPASGGNATMAGMTTNVSGMAMQGSRIGAEVRLLNEQAEKTAAEKRKIEQDTQIGNLAAWKSDAELVIRKMAQGEIEQKELSYRLNELLADSVFKEGMADMATYNAEYRAWEKEHGNKNREGIEFFAGAERREKAADIENTLADTAAELARAAYERAGIPLREAQAEEVKAATLQIIRNYHWTPAMNIGKLVGEAAGAAADVMSAISKVAPKEVKDIISEVTSETVRTNADGQITGMSNTTTHSRTQR